MDYTHYLSYFSLAITIVLTVFCDIVGTEDCGQEELTACSRSLQVLRETSELTFVTKKSELEKLCPDLNAGLHCIRSYTRRCMNMQQRTHFNKLYHGTTDLIHDLCTDGQYQEDFLRHAPCMRLVKREYDLCSTRYENIISEITRIEDETRQNSLTPETTSDNEYQIRDLCCAFREYIACSQQTVLQTCGREAADFTRSYLDKMSHSIISLHCEEFEIQPGKCGVPRSSKASSTKSVLLLPGIMTFVLVTVVGFRKYFV